MKIQLNLPNAYSARVRGMYGHIGDEWLANLPKAVSIAEKNWGFEFKNTLSLSFHFTAAGNMNGSPCVLKVGLPDDETGYEHNAAKRMSGGIYPIVFHSSTVPPMIIMERVFPGTSLASERGDRQRTRTAAGLFSIANKPLEKVNSEEHLNLWDWFMKADQKRQKMPSFPEHFDRAIHERVFRKLPELFADSSGSALLHGDLHHYNILRSQEGYRIIDPKGVIGPIEYEAGPFLMNPVPRLPKYTAVDRVLMDRLAIISEITGWPKRIIREWAVAHAVLSAWWDARPGGKGGAYSDHVGRLYAALKVDH